MRKYNEARKGKQNTQHSIGYKLQPFNLLILMDTPIPLNTGAASLIKPYIHLALPSSGLSVMMCDVITRYPSIGSHLVLYSHSICTHRTLRDEVCMVMKGCSLQTFVTSRSTHCRVMVTRNQPKPCI